MSDEYEDYERRLGKIVEIDLTNLDDRALALSCEFNYGGLYQGLGYNYIDEEFLLSFLAVCGKRTLKDCKGVILYVTGDITKIVKLESLPFEDTPTFDIVAWSLRKKIKKATTLRGHIQQRTFYRAQEKESYGHITLSIPQKEGSVLEGYNLRQLVEIVKVPDISAHVCEKYLCFQSGGEMNHHCDEPKCQERQTQKLGENYLCPTHLRERNTEGVWAT